MPFDEIAVLEVTRFETRAAGRPPIGALHPNVLLVPVSVIALNHLYVPDGGHAVLDAAD